MTQCLAVDYSEHKLPQEQAVMPIVTRIWHMEVLRDNVDQKSATRWHRFRKVVKRAGNKHSKKPPRTTKSETNTVSDSVEASTGKV